MRRCDYCGQTAEYILQGASHHPCVYLCREHAEEIVRELLTIDMPAREYVRRLDVPATPDSRSG